MKQQYENRTRLMLPRRTYTIIRCDGKAFHTYTRQCSKPFDYRLYAAMTAATSMLCSQAQGSVLGYTQSDEISILLTDFADIKTEAWFDGNVQKIVSVAASLVTDAFNTEARCRGLVGAAYFDARVFTIPDPAEVENYFIWRQQDATRNSIQSLAQAHFSHRQLQGVNNVAVQELLFTERGINWNDCPTVEKRGACMVEELEGWAVDSEIPIFTQDREYLKKRIARYV